MSFCSFTNLPNFLFLNFKKQIENTEKTYVLIINNAVNFQVKRFDIISNLTQMYINDNLHEYKNLYVITLFPKQHLFSFENTIENFIDVLTDVRFCEQIHKTHLTQIILPTELKINKNDVVHTFTFENDIPIYLSDKITKLKSTNSNLFTTSYCINLEQSGYKNAVINKIHNGNNVNNNKQKIHFKQNGLKFQNGLDNIHYLGFNNEFILAKIKDFHKIVSFVECLTVEKIETRQEQKKLFAYVFQAYLKYFSNLEYIRDLLTETLPILKKANPKYSFIVAEIKKHIEKTSVDDVCNELLMKISNMREKNDKNNLQNVKNVLSLDFYKSSVNNKNWQQILMDNDVISITLDITSKNLNETGTCVDLAHVNNIGKHFLSSNLFLEEICLSKFENLEIGVKHGLSITNCVLPIYINKKHWEMSSFYTKTILGIFFTKDPSKYTENMLKLYYHILSFSTTNLFFTKNIVNWNIEAINQWFAIFYTCYQISKEMHYYKGFQKYIENIIRCGNVNGFSQIFGQVLSINYKNTQVLYSLIETYVMTKLLKYIDKESIGIKELIEDKDPSLELELENIVKSNTQITNSIECYMSTLFVLAMFKDLTEGLDNIIDELDTSDGMVTSDTATKFYEYCETFKELSLENKLQILVNKRKIPIENIFELKYLTKKVILHYESN